MINFKRDPPLPSGGGGYAGACHRAAPGANPSANPPYKGREGRPGLYRHTPNILRANTTIYTAMLPESLPQDQAVGERTNVFVAGLRHLDHTENFSERDELLAVI